jgi:ubiquinone/menaquinone biosynthesis C-methylase UbiE
MSAALASLGHDIVMIDQADWRTEFTNHLEFVKANVDEGLPFADKSFDLIVSYNAFEHVTDPSRVLEEMTRVCKTSGHIVLDFGPLYASPFGLHAWGLEIPWPQYLLTRQLLEVAIRDMVNPDLGKANDTLQPTNGWLISQYRELWAAGRLPVKCIRESEDYRFLDLVLEFPMAFRGRSLSFEDLITNSIEIVLGPKHQ